MSNRTRYAAAWLAPCAWLLLTGCGGSGPAQSKYIAPDDMPDICQDLDFNRDEQFRDFMQCEEFRISFVEFVECELLSFERGKEGLA